MFDGYVMLCYISSYIPKPSNYRILMHLGMPNLQICSKDSPESQLYQAYRALSKCYPQYKNWASKFWGSNQTHWRKTEKEAAPGSEHFRHCKTPKIWCLFELIWSYLYLIWNILFPFQNGHILFRCTPLSDARTPIFRHISDDLNLRGCTTQTAWKALGECWARCGCGAGDKPWCLHQTWDTSEKIGSSPPKKRECNATRSPKIRVLFLRLFLILFVLLCICFIQLSVQLILCFICC